MSATRGNVLRAHGSRGNAAALSGCEEIISTAAERFGQVRALDRF